MPNLYILPSPMIKGARGVKPLFVKPTNPAKQKSMEIHLRSTNGSIEYRINGQLQLHSIPLKYKPVSELLTHLGLDGCDYTWRWDNSQGMNLTITIEEKKNTRAN